MEKELRLIKNRGYFPVPQITPQDCKIETAQDKNELMKEIDEVATAMLNAVKQSEENYAREQEQVRARDEQLRSVRQTDRSDFNYLTLANSTPIRNDNTRSDQPGVHFNTNPVQHVYSATTDGEDQYEPPDNDSIIQGAGSAPTDQFATNATSVTGGNDPWRRNNIPRTATSTAPHRTSTRPTGHNGLHNNNSPNSSDSRNGPTCFRCGEQGHMRAECRERVFCNHCKTYNHRHKSMQEATQQHPKPCPQPNSNRVSSNSNTTTPNGNNSSYTANTSNRHTQQQPIIPEPTRQQSAQNQHHDPDTAQWHLTNNTSGLSGRNNTDHEPSHQQQQEG